jgi:hypothetical protein
VLKALGAYRFDMMGWSRSHLDFYVGEGWYLSVALTVMVVMCWLLSNAAEQSPSLVGRMSLVIGLFFVASVGLCAAYFFIAPVVFSAVAASSAGAAWWKLRSRG